MKCHYFFYVLLIALIALSCSADDTEYPESNIRNNLAKLEEQVPNIDVTKSINLEIVNKDFFCRELKKIIEANSREHSSELVTAVRDKVASSRSDLTSLSLTEIDTIIFESLFRSLDKFGFKQKALICDVYLKELSAIKLPEIEPSLQRLSYLRDYFIYFFGVNNVETRGFDSCFEKCMKKKASDVFVNGNWVDKVEFLVGMPTNVAWWTGSCTWDCI